METTSHQKFSRGRKGVKKFFRIFFVLLLLVVAGFFYWKYYYTYSTGNRYGLLQKFSHKGNLFKTYEGEMILSSIKGNYNIPIASEKFFFSVTDKNVAGQLMNAQGKFVTVHYREKNGTLSWRGDTPYVVDSVKVEQ
jgi:hypothetical protein